MTFDTGSQTNTPVWKLAILFILTASLYQFYWLYSLARNLRENRDLTITPWYWATVPLLGPLIVFPCHTLAEQLKSWQVDEDCEPGYFAEPILVAMLVVIAYIPFLMIFLNETLFFPLLLVSSLLLCLPYLALQGQLNIIVQSPHAVDAKDRGFSKNQWITMVAGSLLTIPLYVYGFSDYWERMGSSELSDETIVNADDKFFQVKIAENGWTRITPGYLSDESEFEFLGPDKWTWAIVYDNTGVSIDEVMAYRLSSIREDYRGAKCSQRKTLLPGSNTIRGILDCVGHDLLEGEYLFASRAVRRGSNVAEIVAFTSQRDKTAFAKYAATVRSIADGLEIKHEPKVKNEP